MPLAVDVPIIAREGIGLTGVVAFVVDIDFAVFERLLRCATNVVVNAAADGIAQIGLGRGIAGGSIIQQRNHPRRLLL